MKSKPLKEEARFYSLSGKRGTFIISYRVERSSRLKTLQIQIKSREMVALKLPMRCSEQRALDFLKTNSDWVIEMLQKQPRVGTLRSYLMKNPRVSACGGWYPLSFRYRSFRSGYEIKKRPKSIEIFLSNESDQEESLCRLMKELAKELVVPRVEELSKHHRVKVHGVTIRDQQLRWGSCSETAGISLNWRVLLLPPELQDHIILHELAHLKHFDHSSRFYALLERWDRRSQKNSDKLDTLSHGIISLGRKGS